MAAYERWSLTRGSNYSDLIESVLEKWSLTGGGCLREVVRQGGLTVVWFLSEVAARDHNTAQTQLQSTPYSFLYPFFVSFLKFFRFILESLTRNTVYRNKWKWRPGIWLWKPSLDRESKVDFAVNDIIPHYFFLKNSILSYLKNFFYCNEFKENVFFLILSLCLLCLHCFYEALETSHNFTLLFDSCFYKISKNDHFVLWINRYCSLI